MPSSSDDAQRFELRRERRPWGIAALVGVVTLTLVLSELQGDALNERWPQLVMMGALSLAVVYFMLGIGRRTRPEVIEILPRVLKLPFGASSVEVPLDEIEGLALEEGNRPGLFVSTTRFVVFFPRARFASAEMARAVHAAIKARIARLPGGQERLTAIDTDELDLGPSRRPWGAEGIVAVLVLALAARFALASWSGSLSVLEPLDVLRFGANARALVSLGEWWRIPASVLLHANLVHLLLVVLSVLGLGVAAERLLGLTGFLAVFMGSAAAGALASAAFPEGMAYTAGASGGVFGILGSLLYMFWRFRGQIPLRFQIPERTWFGMLAINFLLPIMTPAVDGAMHLGGLLAGVLLTMLVAGDARSLPVRSASLTSVAVMSVLAGLFTVSVINVARTFDVDVPGRKLAVVRMLVGQEQPDPELLNTIAWSYAIGRRSTGPELLVAEKVAERAVDLEDRWDYRDTWATIAFRRGHADRAIDLELEALADERAARAKNPRARPGDVAIASQLARFLDVAHAKDGVVHEVDRAPPVRASTRDGRVVLDVGGPVERPLSVWVLAKENGTLAGIGRYPLPVASGPATVETRESLAWASTASLAVALVASGTVTPMAWPMDADVLAYPGFLEVD